MAKKLNESIVKIAKLENKVRELKLNQTNQLNQTNYMNAENQKDLSMMSV